MTAAVRTQGTALSVGDRVFDYRARRFDSHRNKSGGVGGDFVSPGRLCWPWAAGVTRWKTECSGQNPRKSCNGASQALLRNRFWQGRVKAGPVELRCDQGSFHREVSGLGSEGLPGVSFALQVKCRRNFRPECRSVQHRCRENLTLCPAVWNVDASDSGFSEEPDEAPSPSSRSKLDFVRASLLRIWEVFIVSLRLMAIFACCACTDVLIQPCTG